MYMPDAKFFAVARALTASACASSEMKPSSRVRDAYSIARPSNSSVLFPGEYRSRSVNELPGLWLLQEF
jgi:hypothetical protein